MFVSGIVMETPEINEKLLQFPIARVKKIMKVDPDLNYIHHEAVFLIAKATVSLTSNFSLFFLETVVIFRNFCWNR